MSELLMLAERMRALERRLQMLEASEPVGLDHGKLTGNGDDDHTQYLLATGQRAGATANAQMFSGNLHANNYMVNVSTDADSQLFNAGVGGTPTGWNEADAAAGSLLGQLPGYWALTGSSAETSWKYRKQMAALVGSNAWNSFSFGPVLFRDARIAGDCNYYFGIYRDNSGIDENTFVRCRLWWDYANSLWKMRGERKDGATETDSAWYTLSSFPVAMPLYFRVVVRTSTPNNTVRCYVGGVQFGNCHTLMMDASATYAWGNLWAQMHSTRPATGVNDAIYVAALNRTSDA